MVKLVGHISSETAPKIISKQINKHSGNVNKRYLDGNRLKLKPKPGLVVPQYRTNKWTGPNGLGHCQEEFLCCQYSTTSQQWSERNCHCINDMVYDILNDALDKPTGLIEKEEEIEEKDMYLQLSSQVSKVLPHICHCP